MSRKLIDGETPQIMDVTELVNTVCENGTDQQIKSYPGNLISDSKKVIQDFFRRFGCSLFNRTELPPNTLSALIALAPKLIDIKPDNSTRDKRIQYQFVKKPSLEDVQEVLRELGGEAVEKLDFYHNDKIISNLEILSKYIPEINEVQTLMLHSCERGYPYMVAMSMQPKYRDVPVIALNIRGTSDQFFELATDQKNVKDLCVPSFSELIAVADKYGVKDMELIMQNLSNVIANYYNKFIF